MKTTQLSRRDLLGLAAKGAATVVVSQSLLAACASGANSAGDTAAMAGAAGASAPYLASADDSLFGAVLLPTRAGRVGP